MAIAYCTISSFTFLIIISAFLKDKDAEGSIEAWIFISLATLLWPITLPFILSSKLRAHQEKVHKAKLRQLSSSSAHASKEALL